MGCDTYGKIKGYVKHEDIFEFIKQKYDKNATNDVTKEITCALSECNWEYKMNEHNTQDVDNQPVINTFDELETDLDDMFNIIKNYKIVKHYCMLFTFFYFNKKHKEI